MNNNKNIKYTPIKDLAFWFAFLLGGGFFLPVLIYKNGFLSILVFLNILFLIFWLGVIILKKGQKWSFVFGFLIALVLTLVSFYGIFILDMIFFKFIFNII